MSLTGLTATSAVLVMSVLAASAQDRAAAAGRRLGAGAPPIRLPLTTSHLRRALMELAAAGKTPVGFEALGDEPDQPSPVDAYIATAGRTVGEVLDVLTTADPRYQWSDDGRMLHVRPSVTVIGSRAPLDQPVTAFALADRTLTEAVREVQFIWHPDWRAGATIGSVPRPGPIGRRRFHVHVQDGSVRDVLDAIVLAHGAASWHVTYSPDRPADPRVTFLTFDGWGVTN